MLRMCVCAFSLRRESPDMILGEKSLIAEVVLSQRHSATERGRATESMARMHHPCAAPFVGHELLCD
jgi:hypothetical protein